MDKLLPSQNPPGNMEIDKTPLFLAIGFDDNDKSGFMEEKGLEGMKWAVDAFLSRKNPDGTNCSCAFYCLSRYITEEEALELPHLVKKSWKYAYDSGFEIGCHTHSHHNGSNFTVDEWIHEMSKCNDILMKPYVEGDDTNTTGIGLSESDIISFRAPYLAYNENTFKAIDQMGCFRYDSSLEEGYQDDQDGGNFFYPYTLDEGSPGNKFVSAKGSKEVIANHPGVWEMPIQVVFVPPDELCEKYGTESGFRKRCKERQSYFSENDGKICGLDYNCLAEFGMSR
ncbi:MAG: polysaccharide deacetylase family protein, partial [Lachnospiraceae bacterium]|nr:polysaccharide deacetylase family protein [Lachnospiraceae bacterium]